MYSKCPRSKRIEFRTPDPSCNPYIAFSAILMAGLDGIIKKTHPGDPLDADIYEMKPEELAAAPNTPDSLAAALRALEKDRDFLLQGGVFTRDVIETWIEYKMNREVKQLALRPHPMEFDMYYDV